MFESVNSLEEILEPYAGQTVYCESEDKAYRFDPVEGWGEVKIEGQSNIQLTAYEINQQIIGQLAILDDETLAEKKKMIRNLIKTSKNKFFMALCRDINYYTVFHLDVYENHTDLLEDILIDECVAALGQIKEIEMTEDGMAAEIWFTNPEGATYAMYFFPYDAGVVLCV